MRKGLPPAQMVNFINPRIPNCKNGTRSHKIEMNVNPARFYGEGERSQITRRGEGRGG